MRVLIAALVATLCGLPAPGAGADGDLVFRASPVWTLARGEDSGRDPDMIWWIFDEVHLPVIEGLIYRVPPVVALFIHESSCGFQDMPTWEFRIIFQPALPVKSQVQDIILIS